MGKFKAFFGKAISGIGNLFGSQKMINFGNKLQGKNIEKVIANTGNEGKYDLNTAHINTVEKINAYFDEIREGYIESAYSIEKACWANISNQYDYLINIIEDYPEIFADSSAEKEIKRQKNEAKNKIIGTIKDYISRRFSVDDWECKCILEMNSGYEKTAKLKEFNKKVVREALDNLSSAVTGELQSQIDSLNSILNDVWEKNEKTLKNKKADFDKLSEEDHIDQIKLEYSCIKPVLIYDSADMILDIL